MLIPGFWLTVSFASANAQWVRYPDPRVPLTKNGKPNLTAKTPRAPRGRPDLSGVWQIQSPDPSLYEQLFGPIGPASVVGDDPREHNPYFFNIFLDFKTGEEPLRPDARARTQKNRETLDSPSSHCLPYSLPARYFNARPFRIFQTTDAVAMYFEIDGAFRQIHTDGRALPKDPLPSWMGYSTARWEGDTLVVDTNGFNDKAWMDARGHPQSEALRVQERLHRRDFGHMDIEAIIDDPGVLIHPFTVKFPVLLIPNSDVLETFCVEGERDRAHMPSAVQ